MFQRAVGWIDDLDVELIAVNQPYGLATKLLVLVFLHISVVLKLRFR